MSVSSRVLVGLAAGLLAGAAISISGNSTLLKLVAIVEPLGTLWINAILMTIIPLVFSSLIVSVATTSSTRLIGRIGWRAILLFLILLSAGAVITALVMPSLCS